MNKENNRIENSNTIGDTTLKGKSSTADDANRRSFLRFLTVGAGSAVVGGVFAAGSSAFAASSTNQGKSLSPTLASDLINDDQFWSTIKESFIRSTSDVILNVDGGSVVPQLALNALKGSTNNKSKASDDINGFTTLSSQRSAIGTVLGAEPDDIALVNSTTNALGHALAGFNWRQGDVIFYTDHEHPNVISLIKAIQFSSKIVPIQIKLPISPGVSAKEIAATIEVQISRNRPKGRNLSALVWSSPTYQTGIMLPISRIAKICREYDVVSICDGAHLMGMAAVNFSRLDIDFLATCGHKWQCGPSSTGVLLRDSRISSIWVPSERIAGGKKAFDNMNFGATVSRTVSSSAAKFDSLLASCSVWDDIGRSKIEAYNLSLSTYLKTRIKDTWGARSLRSAVNDPELLSAIASFDPFHGQSHVKDREIYKKFVSQLHQLHGFVVREVKLPNEQRFAIRISTPIWVEFSDIDRLIESMTALTRNITTTANS